MSRIIDRQQWERAFLILFSVLILAGVALRFWHLAQVPYGLDSDQAKVLSWGKRALAEGEWRLFAEESTRFEAASSYLFSLSEKIFGEARVLAALASILDLLLLGLVLRRRGTPNLQTAAAVALLATCPMAIYYARVAGPCVGASTLLLLFIWVSGSRRHRLLKRSGVLFSGLIYYSIFRILLLYELGAALWTRNWKRLAGSVGAALLLLLLSAAAGDLVAEAQLRGAYNGVQGFTEFFSRLGDWFQLWFFSPSSRFLHPIPEFIIDPVTQGFAWALGDASALGLGMSLLFMLALIQWASEGFKLPDFERRFFVFAFLILVLSPTYSHALWILPLVPLFMVLAFEDLIKIEKPLNQAVRWGFLTAVLISCTAGLTQTRHMLERLELRGQFDEVYGDRLRAIFETHIQSDLQGLPVLYFTGQQYYLARYWGERFPRAQVLPGIDVKEALTLLQNQVPRGDRLVVYFDIQDLKLYWADRPAAQEQVTLVRGIERRLREKAQILSVEDIHEFGEVAARRYVIRWN